MQIDLAGYIVIKGFGNRVALLANIKYQRFYEKIRAKFQDEHPNLCGRMKYIDEAQKRFYEMLDTWKAGDVETVASIFRKDGVGLRDDYKISGPELETMCNIARTLTASGFTEICLGTK